MTIAMPSESLRFPSFKKCQACEMGPSRVIDFNVVGGRDRDRTGGPLLAKTRNKIYLVGSLGFILCRSIRFCT
jgi:hypothetical protein